MSYQYELRPPRNCENSIRWRIFRSRNKDTGYQQYSFLLCLANVGSHSLSVYKSFAFLLTQILF